MVASPAWTITIASAMPSSHDLSRRKAATVATIASAKLLASAYMSPLPAASAAFLKWDKREAETDAGAQYGDSRAEPEG